MEFGFQIPGYSILLTLPSYPSPDIYLDIFSYLGIPTYQSQCSEEKVEESDHRMFNPPTILHPSTKTVKIIIVQESPRISHCCQFSLKITNICFYSSSQTFDSRKPRTLLRCMYTRLQTFREQSSSIAFYFRIQESVIMG